MKKTSKKYISSRNGLYLYEKRIYRFRKLFGPHIYQNTIDFVVYADIYNDGNFEDSFTGVELKSTLENLYGPYGRNVYSFSFNYFLFSSDIAGTASRYIEKYDEYKHVGIATIDEFGDVKIVKEASLIEPNDYWDSDHKKYVEESENTPVDAFLHLSKLKEYDYGERK
jgi:hypothetical protein